MPDQSSVIAQQKVCRVIYKVTFTMASAPPVVVQPDTELQFVLSESEATPKCSMTISHPGGAVTEHIAFKVRRKSLLRYCPIIHTACATVRMSFTQNTVENVLLVQKRKPSNHENLHDDHEDIY